MSKFIKENAALIGGAMFNLILLGVLYATIRDEIRVSQDKIKALEDQRSDETRWIVQQHEKRLDAHDQVLQKIVDKLDRISVTIERIDQRTGGKAIN